MADNSVLGKILVVDDDSLVSQSLRFLFQDEYDVLIANSGVEAIELLPREENIDAVILDIKMAKMDGLETASRIKEYDPDLPIVFYTGYPGEYTETTIDRDHQPFEYIIKGDRPERLKRSIKNAVEMHRLKSGSMDILRIAKEDFGLIGGSAVMRQVYQTIIKVAPTDSKVMIMGETGTGKELVARALHAKSRRYEQRLAILNCNHKSPDLVESELFGHKKGAFTGAITDRIGLFEYADGGTAFLDEIGDLDITTQAKILRVLETGEMNKIGSPEISRVEVRVICATHRDLSAMVKDGTFREDLYYRLKGIVINMPPLRERREDLPLLISYFIDDYCKRTGDGIKLMDSSAIDVLCQYEWPGNVRQLLDTIESIMVLSNSALISGNEISDYLYGRSDARVGNREGLANRVREYEKSLIIKALSDSGNNISKAATVLKTDRSNLHKKIKQYDIVINGGDDR